MYVSSIAVSAPGGIGVTYGVVAGSFTGNGSGITNLTGANIVSGIPSAVLPSSVVYLSVNQLWTAPQTYGSSVTITSPNGQLVSFNLTAGSMTVNNLNASQFVKTDGSKNLRGAEKAPNGRTTTGQASQQFNTPHGVTVSNDDIVYVADRANNRVQTFRLDGTFIKEGFVKRESQGTGTAFGVALSADPQQRFLYVADGSNERIAILDRASLEEIGHIGGPGRKAGEFFHLHSLGVDPKGNLITGESQGYRVQRFVYKGLTK